MSNRINLGDSVKLVINYKSNRWDNWKGVRSYSRFGVVVEIGESGKYAGRVRVRWTHTSNYDGTVEAERKIIRTWYNPAKLVVVEAIPAVTPKEVPVLA